MATRRGPAPQVRRTRAERRRRVVRPESHSRPWRQWLRLGALAGVAAGVLLVATAEIDIVRMITWYLAVDQYGYLAFAHDLLHGRVFHEWPPLRAFVEHLPPRVDVLFQTYVYDHGRLFCRYAPGFPIMLAAWIGLFGDDGAHYLNPTCYVALLAVAFLFQARVFRSTWRAVVGTAMIAYFPTFMQYWALTLVRDVPTHLFGLTGLLLLLPVRGRPLTPARASLAGLALGYAASIRPDAILYLVPALLTAATRWEREAPGWGAVGRGLAAGALGVSVGLAPLLLYNWSATGSPFRMTQGMELATLLPSAAPAPADQPPPAPAEPPPAPAPPAPAEGPKVGYPSAVWRGGTGTAVQGGGLRLENVPRTLPQLWIHLYRDYYGYLFVGLFVWGSVLAFLQRRLLFASGVIYTLLALLFFSLWSKPDPRYQIGVFIFVSMLIVEGGVGTLDLVRRFARRSPEVARVIAAAFAVVLVVGWWATSVEARLPVGALQLLRLVAPVLVLGAIGASVWPRGRVTWVVAPVLGVLLAGYSAARGVEALGQPHARFQRGEMRRAREAFNAAVEPRAVVITVEEIGRPAENIDYYSGVAHAFYLTDLERWRISVSQAAELLARAGFVPYLFIPTSQPDRGRMLDELAARVEVERVADIPAADAMDYFVASSAHRGVHMELYRLTPRPG